MPRRREEDAGDQEGALESPETGLEEEKLRFPRRLIG
jgi:hypothetical protein